ncbi:MAG: riboflavin kinase [Collinsella sp.]
MGLTFTVTTCSALTGRPSAPRASAMSWARVMGAGCRASRPSLYAARRCGGWPSRGLRHGLSTANIQVPDGIQVPADGVYEGLVLVDDTVWPAAVNVGLPPTYADDAASAHLEANLIGYAGDLYGALPCR